MCKSNSNGQIDSRVSGDYITKLPESVICHILSRLPTKEAVRTCVLSQDWKFKWTNIYKIAIDGTAQIRGKEKSVFVYFMERISSLSLSHNVRDFELSCGEEYDFTQMTNWISPVLGPKLEAFTLEHPHKGFLLPQSFLKCTLLKSLILSKCTFRVSAEYSFPKLEYLFLDSVNIVSENSNSDNMVLQFPALKTFKLLCSKFNVKSLEIHTPALDAFISHTYSNGLLNDYPIKIIGANLAKFEVYGGLLDRFVLTGSTVECANLCCLCELQTIEVIGLQVQMLFKQLSSMKYLILRSSMLRNFEGGNIGFPQYDKMERIKLTYDIHLNVLLELLHAAPYLKFLEIDVGAANDYDYVHNRVERVPYCITSSLEEVKFAASYYRQGHKFHMERFILKYGACLKTIRLSADYVLFHGEYFQGSSQYVLQLRLVCQLLIRGHIKTATRPDNSLLILTFFSLCFT